MVAKYWRGRRVALESLLARGVGDIWSVDSNVAVHRDRITQDNLGWGRWH